jgi:hypothetical protein
MHSAALGVFDPSQARGRRGSLIEVVHSIAGVASSYSTLTSRLATPTTRPRSSASRRCAGFKVKHAVGRHDAHALNPILIPCAAQVYHPNIDIEGKICLNILREDWKPVLSVSSIIYGLQYLFLVRQLVVREGEGTPVA